MAPWPSHVAHSVTFAAFAAVLLAAAFSYRARLNRAIDDLGADIAARTKTEQALRESNEMLGAANEHRRLLLQQLVSAEESEKRRIADGLHDDPVQKLAAALLRLQGAGGNPPRADAVAKAEDLVTESLEHLRRMMFELRPRSLDEFGLAAAIYDLIGSFGEDLPPAQLDDGLVSEPGDEIRTIAFRTIAEALSNVRKHSKAQAVQISLADQDGGLLMRVSDDGIGADPGLMDHSIPGHIGLPSLRERCEAVGGWARLSAKPTKGTLLEAWIPLAPNDLDL
jgi:signal transduction histidine kinase